MTQIQLRRATAASWTSVNPILALGEVGIETDTRKLKVGNGATQWTGLSYIALGWDDINGKPTDLTTQTGTQALTNKDLTSGTNTFPSSLVTLTGTQTLTNKDLSSGTNTLPSSLVTLTGTQSVSNKTLTGVTVSSGTVSGTRINPRIATPSASATPAINVDTTDQANITANQAITSMTSGLTGTPVDGQKLLIRIKDNGAARAITWGTSFMASGGTPLPTTTVINKTHLIGFIYDSSVAKWVCVAADSAGY